MNTTLPHTAEIAVISAGVSDPSSTRLLADRLVQRSIENLEALGLAATASFIDLAPLATEIATATIGGPHSDRLTVAIARLASADAVIAATPIYKAGVSGLFKSFIDLLDNDLLIARPVLLAATAGSPRHALVVEDQLRPLFGFMRALTLPTSITATPDDWADADLSTRVHRAATELAHTVRARIAESIADATWNAHRHEHAGAATRSATDTINVETALMQLAAGGTLTAAREQRQQLINSPLPN
ncbi:CE1759 family FMN reductase [Microbacterium sp.]|uniref:CE1759 family FMN reductase n=1 Tax=Microbacterium sp. TaxID=51671 RepID=UPI003C729B72